MNDSGKRGEQIAVQYLEKAGFSVLRRNFFGKAGEIDIIAANKEYVVFCEVKTRKSARYGHPQEFVSPAKQRKIRRTAEEWLQNNPGCRLQPRFDVIAIIAPDGGYESASVEHFENGF